MQAAYALAHFDIASLGPDDIAAIENDQDEMQIQLTPEGPWHRPLVGSFSGTFARDRAACGERMVYEPQPGTRPMPTIAAVRRATLEGNLCPGCFTPFELEQSKAVGHVTGRMARIPDSSNTPLPDPPALPDPDDDPDDDSRS